MDDKRLVLRLVRPPWDGLEHKSVDDNLLYIGHLGPGGLVRPPWGEPEHKSLSAVSFFLRVIGIKQHQPWERMGQKSPP